MNSGALIIAALVGTAPVPAPRPLLDELRNYTVSGGCEVGAWTQGAPLGSEAHLSLDDGRLLVFLQVPDSHCVRSNKAVPVMVDPRGRFTWGQPLKGVVTRVSRGPDGVLWAASQGEGGEPCPALWTSKDGLGWRPVELPLRRTTKGPGEKLVALCPADTGMCVELETATDVGLVHSLLWRDSVSPATWGTAATCAPCQAGGASTWAREEGSDAVVFRQGTISVAFPAMLWQR